MPADLLLGGDLGLWALDFCETSEVGIVVTPDPRLRETAELKGFQVGAGQHSATALSIHYPAILTAEELGQWAAVYNLHPGLLPWGRGHFPLVWAIWHSEPAGATLHRMVPKVDAGPIVAQERVDFDNLDTAASLHSRIRAAERRIFARWWPMISNGALLPERTVIGPGSYHSKADFQRLLETDPSDLSEDDYLRLKRALTFPGKPGLRERP